MRPSNIPNAILGAAHLLKLGVEARAAEPGPPPGAAGTVAKLVVMPRANKRSQRAVRRLTTATHQR